MLVMKYLPKQNFGVSTTVLLLLLQESVLQASASNPCAFVSSFTLVNAVTKEDLGKLPRTITLADYPANATFNIRVNVNDTACNTKRVQSVLIKYNESTADKVLYSRTFCERYRPFAVFGDNNAAGTDITNGTAVRYFRHRFANVSTTTNALVQATPYFRGDCKSTRGNGKRRAFVIASTAELNGEKKPFLTTEELYSAVDRWVGGENTINTALADVYGYPIGRWDVSRITDFSNLFSIQFSCPNPHFHCPSGGRIPYGGQFNDDISMWNVSSGTSMESMFFRADRFNGNLSAWDVSSVTNMNRMFMYTRNFHGEISTWDVSSVTKMEFMFYDAVSFNGDLSSWDVSKVANMDFMFTSAADFNGNLSAWNVSSVTSMAGMFSEAKRFKGDLSLWDVSSVTDMSNMFSKATSFNCDLSSWNVSRVSDMSAMFGNTQTFNGDVSTWNVSSVTNMESMFQGASAFDCNLSSWDVSSVSRMLDMFHGATAFNGDVSTWDVSNVTDMSSMFRLASSFNGDISSWDVSGVLHMANMFRATDVFDCRLSSWNLSSAVSIDGMFLNAVAYSQDLCAWGHTLPAEMRNIYSIFGGTSCPEVSDPDFSASPPGPFCHVCV